MSSRRAPKDPAADLSRQLLQLMRAIAAGDRVRAERLLSASPALATARTSAGASAESAKDFFFPEIAHYMYAGDTALHLAAAAYDAELAARLIALGADVGAKNRRGAEPLHYAADTNRQSPAAQEKAIRRLCAAGANPNARDKGGVTPLHRAVRTRGAAAVAALLALGADAHLRNNSGSTPLHLAVQNTGRGGTGDAGAIERQKKIIGLLLKHGAAPSDEDFSGRTVVDAAKAEWIHSMLRTVVTPA